MQEHCERLRSSKAPHILSRSLIRSASLICFTLIFLHLTTEVTFAPHPATSANAFAYLDKLIRKCGELCKVNGGRFEESLFFPKRTVQVSCRAIFSDDVFIQRGHGQSEAPKQVPDKYHYHFTLAGRVPVKQFYFNQMYLTKTAETPVWRKDTVESWIEQATNDTLPGNYGVEETLHLKNAMQRASGIKNGRVLVIGSENPWVEAVALAVGASSIVSLEYGKIQSEHPAIETMTPDVFKQKFNEGSLGLFDVIVTFSSVEHSGLGRYGDALNPWGDVLEVARAYCVCKPLGSLVIGVMSDEIDGLEFNAHRVYGKTRWPYLVSNWNQVYREPEGEQRVHVFTKGN